MSDPAPPPAAEDAPADEARRRTGRERGLLLLLGLAGAVVALAAGAPTWVSGRVAATAGETAVLADGRTAAPLATALGLVALAAVVACTIGRRVARVLAAAALLLAGVGVVVASLTAATSPEDALGAEARAASGRSTATVSAAEVAPWPVVSAVGGVLIGLAGLGVLVRGGTWLSSRRYERDAAAVPASPAEDPAAAWDSLTHGEDPTR
ncbi:Trp biosynthesis-associated membrane protein [Kineococcus rubinsiae]|uniref:Trp biosynthesis-associated membrane protein n=1 Tax=Kineococcus rubinsiae TaxID=2609562 RepID=UPI001431F042|nr:Trp biosynthesis-associated membrane protein [Kineococcus rubinsiae]